MNGLETLVLNGHYSKSIDLTDVVFERLKLITISLEHSSAAMVLQAIENGCKYIESLEITTYREVQPNFRCNKNLTEFRINIAKTILMDKLNLSFPYLEKFTIDHIVTAGSKVLPTMKCLMLKYLDFKSYEIGIDGDDSAPDLKDFY